MRSWGIALNRFCLASWVGAAIFFVAVAIKPIRSPELESPQRALLASLLFPGYYAFGFTLLGLAWVCLGCSRPRYWGWQLALVTIALLLAGIDWFVIYSPLADMTRRQWMEQAAPSSSFRNYHIRQWSSTPRACSSASQRPSWLAFPPRIYSPNQKGSASRTEATVAVTVMWQQI